jgi:hypothetical protein
MCFAFAHIIVTTGPNITHFIPPLMVNLVAHFEPSNVADFMNFIGLLIHKLQVSTKPVTLLLLLMESNHRSRCLIC